LQSEHPISNDDSGAVYIFVRRQDIGVWEQKQKLTSSYESVKFFVFMIRGNPTCSVFIFRFQNGLWIESQILRATPGDISDFGLLFALAPRFASVGSRSGRVFVFEDSPSGFVAKQELAWSSTHLAAEKKTLAVSSSDAKGAVDVFELDETTALWDFA